MQGLSEYPIKYYSYKEAEKALVYGLMIYTGNTDIHGRDYYTVGTICKSITDTILYK